MEKRIYNKEDLWYWQAPCWNFELNADELLDKALETGFVKQVDEDQYLVNNNYKSIKD